MQDIDMKYKRKEKVYLQTQYMEIDKTIYVTYSHMTFIMSNVTCFKNTRGWFYESSCNGLKEIIPNHF